MRCNFILDHLLFSWALPQTPSPRPEKTKNYNIINKILRIKLTYLI